MFDSTDSFGTWIVESIGIIIIAVVAIWAFISFILGAFVLPEYAKVISSNEMKVVPDTYLVSKDHFVELKENNEFRDVYGCQENKGKWSQNGNALTLTQENGSKTELCVFFDSNVLLGVSEDCSCEPYAITKKVCWNNRLIRKGAIADLIPSN